MTLAGTLTTHSNWKWTKAKDVIDIRDGTHDSPKYQASGIPLVTSKNLVDGKIDFSTCSYISEKDHIEISKRSAVDDGDILYAMIGTIGNPVIVEKNFEFSIKNVALFKFNNAEVYNRYFYHLLSSDIVSRQFKKNTRGGTQKFVSLGNMRNIDIPLPPLAEQKRIAAILDKADALRRKREKAIALIDDLLRSVFLDMFGDPVTNPKGWRVERLNNLSTKIRSGTTPVGGSKVYVEKGVVFLRSQNVWRKKLELDDVVYLDEATHRKMNNTSLKNGDILITKTGRINTENSSLGRASIFLGEDDSANINGHVYLIRLKPEVINEFVLYIITTKEYRDYIRSVCVGGIDKRQINKDHLEQFPIIDPPVEAQQQFIERLQVIEKQKLALNKQLRLANNMFFSLFQRAFRGELTTQKDAA
jgi:type I restriction enzyme, S subunit